MSADVDSILAKLRALEAELEQAFDERRAEFSYRVERGRVVFEAAVASEHRHIRTGLLRFLRTSPLLALLTAPVVYALIVPLLLLDAAVCLYQSVCFPIWGVRRVRRGDYLVLDRQFLAYLNGIEKLNCVYCSYANGLIGFVREVASRSEQYWCPIKHAARLPDPHERYRRFVDYGDAAGFRDRLGDLRRELGEEPDGDVRPGRDPGT